jgi:putative exosortase-associated protein (TIGR04073 family)
VEEIMKSKSGKYSVIIVILLCIINFNAFAQSTVEEPESVKPVENYSIGYNLLRGVSNITLGFIEMPRQMCYQSTKIPVIGIIPGVCAGSGLFFWRTCSGVSDILTFGLGGGDTFFLDLPDFPWQGKWFPPLKAKEK